ncbi:zinc-dependent metalloprotease [Corynebacterium amycolatum]|uniref:zinc-dependent metalloprotease n=1 Tax=Corynebacterium TaxID=1716 RepID=UPI000C76BB6E|nr:MULTISPECIES: zinc-dependent metalloprotease [Corynebacterium]KAA9226035.1 zinc-dependent metalloprotease [Corynebacterium amycolatum]MBC6797994.1 hydrolase [Corynebacterium sp. LK31]PLA34951.1 hydrolase [Corynebacterium amycolatum]
MSSNGFGFGPNDNDDDRDDAGNNDSGQGGQGGQGGPFGFFGFPFGGMGGAGGFGFGGPGQPGSGSSGKGEQPNLGDILNQFGEMFSGMGQRFQESNSGPVNYDAAERVARTRLGNPAPVKDSAREALADSLRLAELWLDDVTSLPAGVNRVEAWNSLQWLENTKSTWTRLVDPVASRMSDASLEGVPEEAREMMGPMLGIMRQMNSMSFGTQLGNALAELAQTSLTGSDLGLPLHTTGAAVLLPTHLVALAEELEVPARDLFIYATAREAAHQRLYDRVPWLAERMISSVEEYAAGIVIDYSAIEEAARGLDIENMQDPQRMQEAMSQLQNMDLSPKIRSRNENARTRFQTLLALVEGWVDMVVTDALGERLPGAAQLDEAWRRRRATEGAEQALEKATGIDLGSPKVREATNLWHRLTTAVGIERRDKVWDHPDFLPVAEDLDEPAAFIDSVLGGSENDDFDPIAELEEQLRKEAEKRAADGNDSDADEDNSGDADDDK